MKKLFTIFSACTLLLAGQLSAQYVVYYSEDFESGYPADFFGSPGWNSPDGYWWQIGNAATWSSANLIFPDHSNFLLVNDDGWDADNSYAYASTVFSGIDIPDEPNLKLNMDIYFEGNSYAGATEACELYIFDNTVGLLTELPFTGVADAWQSLEFDFSIYAGHNIYFSVTYFDQSNWMWGVGVDNIKLSYNNPLPPVTVTYQVDVTNYVALGNDIAANGIRIAGNFGDLGATAGVNPVQNWNPTDPASAMAFLGSNIWSTQITYPGTSVGLTQYFKYVNGDWGTNEGTDPENTIAVDGCGVDDGAGNINRTIVIPASASLYKYCWDACEANCPDIVGITEPAPVSALDVFPNPANEFITVGFTTATAENINIEIVNATGQIVYSKIYNDNQTGYHFYTIPTGLFANGLYYISAKTETSNTASSFMVN